MNKDPFNTSGFSFESTYASLPSMLYSKNLPSKSQNPQTILINADLVKSLGLNLSNTSEAVLANMFSGNTLPSESTVISQAYAGHQFGHFTFLGDGRAHLLGEHITPQNKRFDIQLKGSGRTPYSRNGDGKASLGPMLREYIVSEAMHYLHVPTTRSLAVVTTGDDIQRETLLPGAILTRVSSSHIRVGTFEFVAYQQDKDTLQSLMDYTLYRHYPEVVSDNNPALSLLKYTLEKQIDLIVHWMRIGFIHGVMNTDNTSICGETLDYGPCAFLDNYYPNTVFSSIDHHGRYAYHNQPKIAYWNLVQFAQTLIPVIDTNPQKAIKLAQNILNTFPKIYEMKWLCMMRFKLGLSNPHSGDHKLINQFLAWMQQNHADFSKTFYDLSQNELPKDNLYQQKSFKTWLSKWQNRLSLENISLKKSKNIMKTNNPFIIPRNHQIEKVINHSTKGNHKPLKNLLSAIKYPYEYNKDYLEFHQPPQPGEKVYQTFCGT